MNDFIKSRFKRHRIKAFLFFFSAALGMQSNAAVTIDATVPPPPVEPLAFKVGGVSPSGHSLSANSQFLSEDGHPLFPVMGEFHYSRYPASEWKTELLKMKAGGLTAVGTYVFWIHHEEVEGKFDWSGQRDLRKFIQLCGEVGLRVWLRIGPWAHGEVRNGGFPEWLIQKHIPLRKNDPAYLPFVERFYGEIGRQVDGLFWKEGGPIIGVQIENEYHPGEGGLEHMRTLLQLAQAAKIEAPFYSATGWDQAVVPNRDYLPVFGGYTEQFWSSSLNELPPNQNFFFSRVRAEDNVMGDLQPKRPGESKKYDLYPFLTAEMGAGMAVAYHRRPLMQPDDSTAAAFVKVGSGISLLGYYMYHGGTNPDGHGPLQETVDAWNGYNDLEAKSYDFQAPLGEFGQVRPVYRTMKTLNAFLNDFGETLAPMTAHFPSAMPKNLTDISTPRVTARTTGDRGFVFINNYERNQALDDHRNFQVLLKLPSGEQLIPEHPVEIPNGAYVIWPVNLDIGGATLRYATAEPMYKLADPQTYVFFAWPGVRADFSFQLAENETVDAPSATITKEAGRILIGDVKPGIGVGITINRTGKPIAQILVVSRDQALNLWKAHVGGRDRLFLSSAGLSFDGDLVHLHSRNSKDLEMGVFPALRSKAEGTSRAWKEGAFMHYAASSKEIPTHVSVVQKKKAEISVPSRINPNPERVISLEPTDSDFNRAGVWSIQVPPSVLSGIGRAFLKIDYEGDVARLYVGDRFIEDNFFKGAAFEYGLWRLTKQELEHGIDLKILPLRKDTPIYLPASAHPAFDEKGEALKINNISVISEYEAVLTCK